MTYRTALRCFSVGMIFLAACAPEQRPVSSIDSAHVAQQILPLPVKDSLQLSYHPPVGMVLSCYARQDEILDQDSVHLRMRTELYFTQTVERLRPEGLIELQMVYDSIRVHQQLWETDSTRQQELRYNSNDPASRRDTRFAMLTAALGEQVRATLDRSGTVEEISGTAALVRKILGAVVDSLDAEQRGSIEEQLKVQLYGQLLAQQFMILPTKALDSTRRWSRTVEQELPPLFNARATAQYSVGGMQLRAGDSLLSIAAILTGTIELQPAARKAGARLLTGTVRGESSGLLSRRSGVMTQRHNVVTYEIVAESPSRNGTRQRIWQRKISRFDFQARTR